MDLEVVFLGCWGGVSGAGALFSRLSCFSGAELEGVLLHSDIAIDKSMNSPHLMNVHLHCVIIWMPKDKGDRFIP